MRRVFKKRLAALVLAAVFALAAVWVPMAVHANDISVVVDGVPVVFDGTGPVTVGGRTLVPVRGVFETLGFTVEWEAATETAVISNADYVIRLQIGSHTFTTNGISHSLDVPAQLIGAFTMVPIGTPLRTVGFELDWDGVTNTVLIMSPAPIVVAGNDGEEEPELPVEDELGAAVEVETEEELRAAVDGAYEPITIALTADILLSGILTISADTSITLTSTGEGMYALIAGGDFDVIYVEEDAELVIDGIRITRAEGTYGRGINNYGVLVLHEGEISAHDVLVLNEVTLQVPTEQGIVERTSVIRTGWGGGVRNEGDFTMFGGTVSNNVAAYGGGVFNNGEFTLNGGIISNNTASSSGGGVNSSGGFEMNGGIISGNTANWSGGGGIAISSNSEFIMTGGEISGNTSDWDGGGIAISSNSEFIMTGGEVSGNTANWSGGGIAISSNSEFTMIGGVVSGNTADDGGGIYVSGNSEFTTNGGEITGNNALTNPDIARRR